MKPVQNQLLTAPNHQQGWLGQARSPLSYLTQYPARWSFFQHKSGVQPWFNNPKTAIAWSDPITTLSCNKEVLEAFTRDMRGQKRNICLFVIDDTTAQDALRLGYSVYKVAETPWFDLRTWEAPKGNKGKNLRWCMNHARKNDVTITEYRPALIRNIRHESNIKEILNNWMQHNAKRAVTSILQPAPFEAIHDKRLFIASRNSKPIAFLSCAPIPGINGFYLEDIVRSPGCINGTGELLIVEALQALKKSGIAFAALGPAPMRNRAQQIDARAKWISPVISLAVFFLKRFYPIDELGRYPEKFQPSYWGGAYLAFKPIFPSPRLVFHIIKTITG